jgi:thioredoxin-disulfide reductase
MANDKTYDVSVVGYGPAGVTAAIYAARKKLQVALIGELPGGEVRNSGEIENWPGDGVTTGNALADKMVAHVKHHQDDVDTFETKVRRILKDGELFTAETAEGTTIRSRTVIYAAGRHPRQLGVKGESEFRNRGVSYCATCDAPLFTGKSVAVIGGGNTAAEAVIMLQKIARKIYIVQLLDTLTADPVLIENFKNDEKVTTIYSAQTTEIEGSALVEKLHYQHTQTGEKEVIEVDGVFVLIGAVPNTEPVKDLLTLDQFGAIPADRYGRTALPGFFAAGDVTDIRDAQIVVAAGHGCSAALSAGDWLARQT